MKAAILLCALFASAFASCGTFSDWTSNVHWGTDGASTSFWNQPVDPSQVAGSATDLPWTVAGVGNANTGSPVFTAQSTLNQGQSVAVTVDVETGSDNSYASVIVQIFVNDVEQFGAITVSAGDVITVKGTVDYSDAMTAEIVLLAITQTDCGGCSGGTFLPDGATAPNGCVGATQCDATSAHVVTPATGTTDTVCACNAGFYYFGTTAGLYSCSACSTCQSPAIQQTACSATQDTVCVCPNSSWFRLDRRRCNRCSNECPAGQYLVHGCTANADRVCAPCTPACGVGFFEDVPCSTWGDRSCGACDDNCAQCSGHGRNLCHQCMDGYTLDQHHDCVLCDSSCRTCDGTRSDNCRSCSFPRYLNSRRCRL